MKKIKLTGRLTITVLAFIFLFNTAILLIIGFRTTSEAKKSGAELARLKSGEVALEVERYMEQAILAGHEVANVFIAMKNYQADRNQIPVILKEILKNNASFLALWSMWETDTYDGRDRDFKNDESYIQSGGKINFTYYKSAGEIGAEPGIEEQYSEDYYTISKSSKQVAVLDPYQYTYTGDSTDIVYETSVVVPIILSEQFIGAVGIDIELQSMQKIVGSKKIYETGFAVIVSNEGQIASHPDIQYREKKVDELFTSNKQEIKKAISEGAEFEHTVISEFSGKKVLRCFYPVKFRNNNTPWSVMVEIPLDEVYANARALIILMFSVGLLSMLIMSVLIIFIARNITRPIIKSVNFAKEVSSGNLDANLSDIYRTDELGELSVSLTEMSAQIHRIITSIYDNANGISSASFQLSSASQQIAEGANEQASSVEEVSSTMEQMASNIAQNDDNSKQANTMANNSLNGIREVATRASQAMDASRNIAQKIKIVNDIAFQTNILALNAAVEAARAGEHGKGFAVVAAEVRKLAERSKIAADEIVGLANQSLQLAEDAGQYMLKVVPDLEKTTQLVTEITASSNEQANGAAQVNNAIQQLSSVAQQNAASSENLATNAQQLAAQAEQLKEVISFFKSKDFVRKEKLSSKLATKQIIAEAKRQSQVNHSSQTAKQTVQLKFDENTDDGFESF